jgi:hypothetical protein
MTLGLGVSDASSGDTAALGSAAQPEITRRRRHRAANLPDDGGNDVSVWPQRMGWKLDRSRSTL